jgi:A/G-specific adenine glycosylase
MHPSDLRFFRERLKAWAAQHPRPLPWKLTRDPYHIWLSEIILQQTRVEQGLPYYEHFVTAYPTVRQLADAPDTDVMRLWEGLGYYARARNLLAAARHVAYERGGVFPDTYDGIRALRGVGDYTAAAIASFAYDLPHAVLDGNVFRVLARWQGIGTPIDSTEGKRQFAALAQQVLDPTDPAAHNQAMMDFGATWCTPARPRCAGCFFEEKCVARQTAQVSELPVKAKKMIKKNRFLVFFVFRKDNQTFLRQRTERDIWQDLYTFPSVELAELPTDATALRDLDFWGKKIPDATQIRLSQPFQQTLTHRVVTAVFAYVDGVPDAAWLRDCVPARWDAPRCELPVPRIVEWFWQAKDAAQGRLF